MKVKKYVVDSMPDALQKIRSELGKDAVIINTKEIRVGGFLGMFTKKKVEVVAATDTNPDSAAPVRANASSRPMAAAAAAARPYVPPIPESRIDVPMRTAAPAVAVAPPPSDVPTARHSPVKEDALLQEMKQMKEMMQRLTQATGGLPETPESTTNPVFERLRTRLVDQDVRDEVAREIIRRAEEALSEENKETLTVALAAEAIKAEVIAILTARPIEPIRPEARIVHFVGPTGVGKTTTIAKLAAEQALKHRKSIGLITSDTYRIAAIEQLRTYASILNVPLEVVFSPLDLQKALEKMADRDMILMDTAGRNFRNEMAVSELHSLLRTNEKKDTFLVLSLSMKYTDMRAVTDNFHRFGLEKVLFTKADETATFGSVVNLLYDFPLSLSYITDGQNVPDDINTADARIITDELVGEHHDE
ncbi:flagellar biosynthesis protein FlhF [Paenibacillus sp. TRM 82003]|nr:flagellar biosynthesis protein FlhF [Paenibacillus sp. TRM 82003]